MSTVQALHPFDKSHPIGLAGLAGVIQCDDHAVTEQYHLELARRLRRAELDELRWHGWKVTSHEIIGDSGSKSVMYALERDPMAERGFPRLLAGST